MSESVSSSITPIRVGLGLTAVVLLLFAAMAIQERCIFLPNNLLECRANYEWFFDSPPNEIGDTLAGFAGSLAFIWIVITVWLQSTELAEQREVLLAQKEEFKAMVAAQNAQVDALRAQAATFEDEKKRRDENANVLYLEESLRTLFLDLSVAWLQRSVWRFEAEAQHSANVARRVTLLKEYHGPSKIGSPEDFMPYLPAAFEDVVTALRSSINGRGVLQSSPDIEEFRSIANIIGRMLPVIENLSSAPAERFARLKLRETHDLVSQLIDNEEFWMAES